MFTLITDSTLTEIMLPANGHCDPEYPLKNRGFVSAFLAVIAEILKTEKYKVGKKVIKKMHDS